MEAIVLTDDELKRLETRFGPVVRHMGARSSIERIVDAYRVISRSPHRSQ